MVDIPDDIHALAREWFLDQQEIGIRYGYMGKPVGGGTFVYDVPFNPGFTYVRITNNQGEIVDIAEAINFGALQNPKLLVRLRPVDGVLVIEYPNPQSAVSLYGKNAAVAASGRTTHGIDTGNPDIVESRRLLNGLVHPSTQGGMFVTVQPFAHENGESQVTDYDLTDSIPSSGKQRWVIVGADIQTNEVFAVDGPEISIATRLTRAALLNLARTGLSTTQIGLHGVGIRSTTTAVANAQFEDLRLWRLGATVEDRTRVNGRLTLTSGSPVPTSDVSMAEALFYAPYQGNMIGLHDGSGGWHLHSFDEQSLALPGSTHTNYDVFGYNDDGELALETVAWSDANNRATALITQDGIYVQDGDTTKRYLGTFRTTGESGETEDSQVRRFVWNYYNRVGRPMKVEDSSAHSYDGSWRPWNNDDGLALQFVIGVREDSLCFDLVAEIDAAVAGDPGFVGLGLNSAASNDHPGVQNGNTEVLRAGASAPLDLLDGFNYAQIVESGDAGNAPGFNYANISAIFWG